MLIPSSFISLLSLISTPIHQSNKSSNYLNFNLQFNFSYQFSCVYSIIKFISSKLEVINLVNKSNLYCSF